MDSTRIISAVSRTLKAHDDWDDILECAENPDIEIIISDTGPDGIMLDDFRDNPEVFSF